MAVDAPCRFRPFAMVSSLTQAEVLIALVVAAHAGVLAIRLSFSLYKA
jgi:photosystem I subunit 12